MIDPIGPGNAGYGEEYRVTWEIDVCANSPEEAAAVAKWYQLNGDDSSVFNVFADSGIHQKQVDLDFDSIGGIEE